MEIFTIEHFANTLSIITIFSCFFLKIPQIQSVRMKKSAEGIYIQAMLLEIIGFTIMTLYNYLNQYNIITYLEYPIILLEVFIMMYYVLKYKRLLHSSAVPAALFLYTVLVSCFMIEILPMSVIAYLVPFCTPISGFAKVTYIYGIFVTANADAVSLATWVISILTNLSRLFTVYLDSGDAKLMFNFVVSALLSGAVLATAVYYQNRPRPAPGARRRKSGIHHHID